jgi:hypothetical protein
MKVKDLIDQLSKLDPSLDVVGYSEDADLLPSDKHLFRLLDILEVKTTEAERVRDDERRPYLKLGKSSSSVELVTLSLTVEF